MREIDEQLMFCRSIISQRFELPDDAVPASDDLGRIPGLSGRFNFTEGQPICPFLQMKADQISSCWTGIPISQIAA